MTTQQYYNKLKAEGKITVGETITEESLTVPSQSMSINEIFLRFSLGQTLEEKKPHHFDGENPTFDDYDITQNPDFDLVDAENEKNRLELSAKQRHEYIKAEKAKRSEVNKAEKTSEAQTADKSEATDTGEAKQV